MLRLNAHIFLLSLSLYLFFFLKGQRGPEGFISGLLSTLTLTATPTPNSPPFISQNGFKILDDNFRPAKCSDVCFEDGLTLRSKLEGNFCELLGTRANVNEVKGWQNGGINRLMKKVKKQECWNVSLMSSRKEH